MKRGNRFWRLYFLLLTTFAVTVALYFLPSHIGEFSIKKVDLLADLRKEISLDSLDMLDSVPKPAPISIDTTVLLSAGDSAILAEQIEAAKRDSLYQILLAEAQPTDSLSKQRVLFEDFSPQHNGLQRLYSALSRKEAVRIAFLGDSFIEGDIFTLDVRNGLQRLFGGTGVGWMPLASNVAGFRQGIKHTFSGFSTHTAVSDSRKRYFLNESCYAQNKVPARVYYLLYTATSTTCEATLYYRSEEQVPLIYTVADSTHSILLEPALPIGAHKIEGVPNKITLSFPEETKALFYGVALDANKKMGGIAVDNFSLRGSSGLTLINLDSEIAERMDTLRHYQLIVLQYGLNVMQENRLDYRGYADKMRKVVTQLKQLFPESDILIMGPPDHTGKVNGQMATMPGMLALRKAMHAVARDTEVVFWDTYGAMQVGGGMVAFVKKGWAAKDYTHMSFRGGRFLADKFIESFLFEREYYNQIKME